MKKQLTRLAILIVALAIACLILSCSPAPQNSNTVANTNKNLANSNEDNEVVTAESDDPCDSNNTLTQKKDKLKKAVEDKIKGDVSGNDALDTQYKNGNFYLDFAEGTGTDAGYVIATVSGAIQGQKKFKKLVDFIEDFVKKDCKIRVVFKASVRSTTAYPPTGFEWCEAPLLACPGGYCAPSCDFKRSGLESNTNNNSSNNGNSRTNSSPGANSNASGNTNRAP